jgi:phosphate uptake regulator
MDDKLLLLQIAFSIVADSSDYISMSIDNRVDEVKRVYEQLMSLTEDNERDTHKTCQ